MELLTPPGDLAVPVTWVLFTPIILLGGLLFVASLRMARKHTSNSLMSSFVVIITSVVVGLGGIVGAFVTHGKAVEKARSDYVAQVAQNLQAHYKIRFDEQVVRNVVFSPENTGIREFLATHGGSVEEMGMAMTGNRVYVLQNNHGEYIELDTIGSSSR